MILLCSYSTLIVTRVLSGVSTSINIASCSMLVPQVLITNALLHSIEGGVQIGIQCKIRSWVFIWSLFDLNERIRIKILCLFHKQIFFCPIKLWKLLFKTLDKCFHLIVSFAPKTYFTNKLLLFLWFFLDQSCFGQTIQTLFILFLPIFNNEIFSASKITFILTSVPVVHKKISCLYDDLGLRNDFSNLNKS